MPRLQGCDLIISNLVGNIAKRVNTRQNALPANQLAAASSQSLHETKCLVLADGDEEEICLIIGCDEDVTAMVQRSMQGMNPFNHRNRLYKDEGKVS